jgi:hypothetical protein
LVSSGPPPNPVILLSSRIDFNPFHLQPDYLILPPRPPAIHYTCAIPFYQCYSPDTDRDYVTRSQPSDSHTTQNNNNQTSPSHTSSTPTFLQHNTTQPWSLYAHQTAATRSPPCHTATTLYPAAQQVIPTTQFLPTRPSHTRSAKCRHGSNPSLRSRAQPAQALKVSVAQPTRPATQTRLQHQ